MKSPYTYEAFISHAFEDQKDFANALHNQLRSAGIKVWYSGANMRVGLDLKETILDEVIPDSQFGIVIISSNYFLSDWGRIELEALHEREALRSEKIILPIWHNVNEEEIKAVFPYLASRFAVKSEKGLGVVSRKIIKEIRRNKCWTARVIPVLRLNVTSIVFSLFALALVSYSAVYLQMQSTKRERISIVKAGIDARIRLVNDRALSDFKSTTAAYTQSTVQNINEVFATHIKSNHICRRNDYEFTNGISSHKARRYIETLGTGVLDFQSLHGIEKPLVSYTAAVDVSHLSYALLNTSEVTYTITEMVEVNPNQLRVVATYSNWLRFVNCNLMLNRGNHNCEEQVLYFYGLSPVEEFIFEQKESRWTLVATK